MVNPMRLLVAAALFVLIGPGVAVAQTVKVRKAPPDETIELFLNATKVATASIDANGEATLPLNLRENNSGKTEIDANIFIDACDKIRRIIVVERGQPAAAQEPGCDRRDIAGLYWVRHVNTLVVDVGGPNPTMMLVKGSYDPGNTKNWSPSPTGLILFGGIGRGDLRDASAISCGNAPTCDAHNAGLSYTGGVTIWVTRYLAAEGSYFRPPKATAKGSGSNYSFDSTLDPQVVTIAGRVGVPIGPVRLSAAVGTNFQDSVLKTHQTINGASQDFEVETQGWGWLWGGGIEVWATSFLAIYSDVGFAKLKGTPTGGGEMRFDDRLRYITVGARVKIFGK